mmetsp:Transcript_45239/g.76221  ORF Transcript_45239/g.76221 Transcript_45239/m.76221 type:complete len:237 (-) Transcript_45239:194-904(-)
MSRTCDGVNFVSSIRSKSLLAEPHSRRRCSGIPYVSHALLPTTSSASLAKSSRTSSSSSSSASMSFQYRTIASSSVHSRTTTHTGSCSKGRMTSVRSPSVDTPSVAITTTAFFPLLRNSSACARTLAVTCRICSHIGVLPAGVEDTSWSSMYCSRSGEPWPSSTVWTPFAGLRSRNSVRALVLMAKSPAHFSVWLSSFHREQDTSLEIGSCASYPTVWTSSCPSPVVIDPELSITQ